MSPSRTIVLVSSCSALCAATATAQSNDLDYIVIQSMPQTYVGQHPPNAQDWVLPGGGCLAVVGPGNVGGNPQRHTESLVAIGWNDGPNGVGEWGMGDDVVLGPVKATWSMSGTANEAHSGEWCLHDSPAGYSSADGSATIDQVFDLTLAGEATLSFWHHWEGSYSSGGNTCYVEASTNGGAAWQVLETYRYFGGFHGTYLFGSISLAALAGSPLVQIRFRMDASTGNGWTIDDVLLLADGEVLLLEDFETGTDGWLLDGTWALYGEVTDTPYVNTDTIGQDRLGNTLAVVDGLGVVSSNPVGLPTATREGMGYSWVEAELGPHRDGVVVYSGAMSYVPE